MTIKPILFAAFCTAVSSAALSSIALADDCSLSIDSNDAMQFNTKTIEVKQSCETFTLHLNHTGKLPKNVMGHNWVLTKASDMRAVASEGMAAGLDNNYVKPGDARVIAATPIIGGGEKTSVSIALDKLSADESYMFFCSYPGHFAIMQGVLRVK